VANRSIQAERRLALPQVSDAGRQFIRSDHLSAEPGNVGEFDSCDRDVRELMPSWGSVEKSFCQGNY